MGGQQSVGRGFNRERARQKSGKVYDDPLDNLFIGESNSNSSDETVCNLSPSARKGQALTVLIGDLHGNSRKLLKLWVNLESKIGEEAFQHVSVIFLGDYCDRGPDTRGILEFLSTLEDRYPNQSHAFIAGNHDFAMAAFLGLLPPPPADFSLGLTWKYVKKVAGDEVDKEGWWEGEDAEDMHLQGRRWGGCVRDSVTSAFDSAPTFNSYGVRLGDRAGLLASMPEHHKEFLRQLKWVHEVAAPKHAGYRGVIAVHAGLEKDKVAEQLEVLRKRDVTRWKLESLSGRASVRETPPELRQRRILVVSGHHAVLKTSSKFRVIVDESGGASHDSIPLAAVILPERTVVRSTDRCETHW